MINSKTTWEVYYPRPDWVSPCEPNKKKVFRTQVMARIWRYFNCRGCELWEAKTTK